MGTNPSTFEPRVAAARRVATVLVAVATAVSLSACGDPVHAPECRILDTQDQKRRVLPGEELVVDDRPGGSTTRVQVGRFYGPPTPVKRQDLTRTERTLQAGTHRLTVIHQCLTDGPTTDTRWAKVTGPGVLSPRDLGPGNKGQVTGYVWFRTLGSTTTVR